MTEQARAWGEAREVALTRDNYKCVVCHEDSDLHIHHRIPRHIGGTDEPSNLTTLCGGCHAARHPTLQVSLSRRWIELWAMRIARLLDRHGEIPQSVEGFMDVLQMLDKERFRDGQLEIVLAALRGESMLVIRPTGSGKTLCFQVPTLLRPGTAYVISPLKTLMANQISKLQALHVPGTFINSDLSPEEKRDRYDLHVNGAWKFMYLTPERFDSAKVRNPMEIDLLTRMPPSYFVVDEAHCIDRWGDVFRPSYGHLDEVRQVLGNPPVLAFTATAGIESQKRILTSLGIPGARRFITGVNRPNICLIRHKLSNDTERFKIIHRLVKRTLNKRKPGKTMIFVPTLIVGEEVRVGLLSMGLDVPFFHGQLEKLDREFLLNRFTGLNEPEINTIICTNAFGMGLDIENVRTVIHWLQPASVEDYLQEFGRAGRDGEPAVAVVFKRKDDIGVHKYMVQKTYKDVADASSKVQVSRRFHAIEELDEMIRNEHQCFRRTITNYFDDQKPKKRSLAMRIVEWLFSIRKHVKQGAFCCDACAPKEAFQFLYADEL